MNLELHSIRTRHTFEVQGNRTWTSEHTQGVCACTVSQSEVKDKEKSMNDKENETGTEYMKKNLFEW